ncbi:hypothetical protein WN943_006481 [Citrus x changshan-huyou]
MPDRLSVTNPSVSTNVLGYGAFIGLHANMRYQLLCGFDRDVANHFEVIGVAMLLSTALRPSQDVMAQHKSAQVVTEQDRERSFFFFRLPSAAVAYMN